MNDAVIDHLRTIAKQVGLPGLRDARRVENLLNDLTPKSLETNAIIQALKANAADRLASVPNPPALAAAKAQLLQELQDRHGLKKEPARWAIDAIESVLPEARAAVPTPPTPEPRHEDPREAVLARLRDPATRSFAVWVEALLAGLSPRLPEMQAARAMYQREVRDPMPAGCAEPVTRPPFQPPLPVVVPTPDRVLSSEEEAHEAFGVNVRSGDAQATARAWWLLRAIDPVGLTDDERQAGSAAVMEWGRTLIATGGER